jgi:ubiquinone/menaquinone biosynthesis C-methylase UbiE
MGWYDDKVLPHFVNAACASRPTARQRQKIVPLATGDVLEVGFGSGLNLPFYEPQAVRRVWGLEPSDGMRRKATPAIEDSDIDVEMIDLPGEQIPLDDDSVDTVLVTYTLCTIPDVHEALAAMRRVLKPGGRLLFCEHGRAPDAAVLRWQHRVNPFWSRFAGGCNINRDIPTILDESGFDIVDDNRMYIPGLRILCYNYWGTAEIR